MARLSNKTAVITGGTTGIGFENAKQFLAEGARVIVTGQNECLRIELVGHGNAVPLRMGI